MQKKKIFYGWWIVWVCAVLNFFIGGVFFYGFTVFFNPIKNSFGWSAAATSVAFTFQRLEMGLLAPVSGILVDRVGPRKMMLAGWMAIGIGYLAMSRINSLWTFYGTFIFIAIGVSFGTFVVMNAAVANWFTKKRSRAMALIYVGFGASGLLVPLVSWLIVRFDWRMTLVIVGIGLLVICLPQCLVMRHKPEPYGLRPDGENNAEANGDDRVSDILPVNGVDDKKSAFTIPNITTRDAVRTKVFWLLAFTFLFQHIATSAVMVHIVPYLESVNVPMKISSFSVTGMTVCSLIGRMGFGFLGDFTNKRYLIAVCFILQALGVFIFSFVDENSVWLLIPFLLLYAPGYGGPIPLRPAIQADYFGTSHFGTILGLMALVSLSGGLFSPVFTGWIFDFTGSYTAAWRILTLTTLPGIPLILLAKPPKR